MIAVVEDEKELCESLKLLLIDKGYDGFHDGRLERSAFRYQYDIKE